MRSLGCFWCPSKDYSPRNLSDPCPKCGRRFDAPLTEPPAGIGQFTIREPIARGFYGATYRAEQGSLGRTVVLKVVPVASYVFHRKNWTNECKAHAEVSKDNPSVANITDALDTRVDFGAGALECHVAVLENLEGPTLEEVLRDPVGQNLTPRMAAQIAADLFDIMGSLSAHERFHNDLHSENIIVRRLGAREKRAADAFDPNVRAVAIDFGSMSDESRSGEGERINDQHHVAQHLARLADGLRRARHDMDDQDFRITEALRGLGEHLSPEAGAQRIMSSDDARARLSAAMQVVDEPWRQPLTLKRLGDAQNAQVLDSWHVPELWSDPDGRWFARTTGRGPQVITGMRGCGKTMLLQALHFHARARAISLTNPKDIIGGLRKDRFLGLFASGQKLLNPKDAGSGATTITAPFERLYVAYLRDAIQVLRHLQSIDPNALAGPIERVLLNALQVLDMDLPTPTSPEDFDHKLAEVQFALADKGSGCRLRTSPADAFGHLAGVLRKSSSVFSESYILFLLDDVSSRYLPITTVRDVISSLIFQQTTCAFRITTEAQALQRAMQSPGGIEPADPNRDYDEVDLGNEVYRIVQEGSPKTRIEFISTILSRRARQLHNEWSVLAPEDVLGDVLLAEIAREIVSSSATSPKRKEVYRGIRALLAVCVGDIGDVVKLYEKITQRGDARQLPVPAEEQTKCFLEHSAGLLHVLNRRQQRHKDLAVAFAQAASELMQRSARGNGEGKRGLRQYTKLYVRVEPGEGSGETVERIFELLDAGVFVFDGGAPRTKTRDDDPVLQFKLSYRKMLGLASYIGISDRDRFELSGEKLRQFLFDPAAAKEILLESEARRVTERTNDDASGDAEDVEESLQRSGPSAASTKQKGRAATQKAAAQIPLEIFAPRALPGTVESAAPQISLRSSSCTLEDWRDSEVDALVLALGFEDRTLESVKRILARMKPRRVIAVRYTDDGQGRDIEDHLRLHNLSPRVVRSPNELRSVCETLGSSTIVDSSGLSKTYLFSAVRTLLARTRSVRVVHTLANDYYPTNQDLSGVGVVPAAPISGETFSQIGQLLTGEEAPYSIERVHAEAAPPERKRALIASASPKNLRLAHLLDERTYEAVRILVPRPTSPRRRVARTAAELGASTSDAQTLLVDADTNDLDEALAQCISLYRELYFDLGMNVEFGLTGSKMHAVACAALAAACRISFAWYVVPARFDEKRFTVGVSETQCFRVDWLQEPERQGDEND